MVGPTTDEVMCARVHRQTYADDDDDESVTSRVKSKMSSTQDCSKTHEAELPFTHTFSTVLNLRSNYVGSRNQCMYFF